MTNPTPTQPAVENVTRGAVFALAAIPASIIIFALAGGFFGINGFPAIVVPYIAGWLYATGAGAALTRRGWLPYILISLVAVVVGLIVGLFAAAFHSYTQVGGDNPFAPQVFTTAMNQLRNFDGVLWILVGLGLGVAAIVGTVRGVNRTAQSGRLTPAQTQQLADEAAASQNAGVVAPPAPPAPPAAPAAPAAPNQPSPSVLLNGKPIDPNAKN